MSNFLQSMHSRRNVIASMFAAPALLKSGSVGARQGTRPLPVDLGHGLEIRDYRLFPAEDVLRFIVEIHNTTDAQIDTPMLGVSLPHLSSSNPVFAWANPVSMVLHPHASECLTGVAPKSLSKDEEWGNPEWQLCHPISTEISQNSPHYEITFSHRIEVVDPKEAFIYLEVKNLAETEITRLVFFQPTVWDKNGRICGTLPMVGINGIGPNDTASIRSRITPLAVYPVNPILLIDNVEHMSVSYTQQPGVIRYNQRSCNSVLPWNN